MLNKFKITLLALILSSASLLSQTFGGGSGTLLDPYLISNKAHWDEFAMLVNSGNILFLDKAFKLTSNIGDRANPVTGMVGTDNRAECFAGSIDGDNYTITVNISSSNIYVGLLTQLYGGFITNLKVAGQIQATNPNSYVGGIVGNVYEHHGIFNCHNFAEIKGNAYATGGIVGWTKGAVHFCTNNGDIQITNDCYIGGIVGRMNAPDLSDCDNFAKIKGSANSYVGGIIGYAEFIYNMVVHSCNNFANLELDFANLSTSSIGGVIGVAGAPDRHFLIFNSTNYGTIQGNNNVGGIVGIGSALIEGCINNGIIEGIDNVGGIAGTFYNDSVNYCYNNATIVGNDCVGGIVGSTNNLGATIYSCFNNGTLIGNSNVSGMIGCP